MAPVEIAMEAVEKRFGDFVAVTDVTLDVTAGEIHVFLGPSGCGKTTLLRMIAGFDSPTAGRISHKERPVTGPSRERGFIFQEGVFYPWRTVAKNVAFGLELRNVPAAKRARRVEEYLDLVGLSTFGDHYPAQISGGMKQRMVLATVLANEPDVLLMDEPFGALDAQTRHLMQRELLRIWGATRKTIVFVTHSIREALTLADRVSIFRTRPGGIIQIIDLDAELGQADQDRDLAEPALRELETEIYQRLSPFMPGGDDGDGAAGHD